MDGCGAAASESWASRCQFRGASRIRQDCRQAGGVGVRELVVGGPAQRAGLVAGDIIVRIGEAAVTGIDDLLRLLDHRSIGMPVQIHAWRTGGLVDVAVVPEDRE